MAVTIAEKTGLTIAEEKLIAIKPAMILQGNGLPATPQTAFKFIRQGKLPPALDYIKTLVEPGVKTILLMDIIRAAAETGWLAIALQAASLAGMKLTDQELMLIFRASLAGERWKTCLDCLGLFSFQQSKRLALDLLTAKGAEAGAKYRRGFKFKITPRHFRLILIMKFKLVVNKIINFSGKFWPLQVRRVKHVV